MQTLSADTKQFLRFLITLPLQPKLLQCVFQYQCHEYPLFHFLVVNLRRFRLQSLLQGQWKSEAASKKPTLGTLTVPIIIGWVLSVLRWPAEQTKEKKTYSKQNTSCPKAWTSVQVLLCWKEKKQTCEKIEQLLWMHGVFQWIEKHVFTMSPDFSVAGACIWKASYYLHLLCVGSGQGCEQQWK